MPNYNQHPDELIKKADRKPAEPVTPPVEPVVPGPAEAKSLDDLKAALPSLLFGDEPPKVDDKKVVAAPAAAPVVPDPNAPPTPEPEKKTTVRKAPDALEIARETGKAIADNIKPMLQPLTTPVATPQTGDPLVHLAPDDRENYDLFKTLSDTDARYKGRHEDFLRFVNKLAAYKRNWERSNAGQTFDPNDTTHEDFYSENQPQFEESDLDKARIRMETKKEVERELKTKQEEYDRKLKEIEEKAVGPEVTRRAAQLADTAINQFVGAIPDDAIKEGLKDPTKLQEADPIAFEVLNNEAGVIRDAITELHNIIHRPDYFNPQNQTHMRLAAYIDRQEQFISQLPLAQQTFENKRFTTRESYSQMTPTQRQSHWILTEPDVVDMITRSSAQRVTQVIAAERKKIESTATKYGFKKDAAAAPTTQAAVVAPAVVAAPASPKTKAPPATAGDALPPTNSPGTKVDGPVEKQLVSMLW